MIFLFGCKSPSPDKADEFKRAKFVDSLNLLLKIDNYIPSYFEDFKFHMKSNFLLIQFHKFWPEFVKDIKDKNFNSLEKKIDFPINVYSALSFSHFIDCLLSSSAYSTNDSIQSAVSCKLFLKLFDRIFHPIAIKLLEKITPHEIDSTFYANQLFSIEYNQVRMYLDYHTSTPCPVHPMAFAGMNDAQNLIIEFNFQPESQEFKLCFFENAGGGF